MAERHSTIPPEVIEEYQNLCLLDDIYARAFFKDNIQGIQYVLRIIMNKKDLVVKSVETQKIMAGPDGAHSVRFDVYAEDSEGRQYDIELQIKPEGATTYRAVYNVSILTVNTLKPNESYPELANRERVVIFITATDVLKGGLPLYTLKRIVMETGEEVDDGEMILYVNASHKDMTTELGRLLHDIRSKRTADMLSRELAEHSSVVRKEEEAMSAIKDWEDKVYAEGRAEGKAEGGTDMQENIARKLIQLGQMALEEIAGACSMTLQRVQELAMALQA